MKKQKSFAEPIHPDLITAKNLAYEPCGLIYQNLMKEAESEEYGAFSFEMNNKSIKFRVGKITPTKVGQFVTLWKRAEDRSILPYDLADPIDLFVISVRNAEHFGQFVFPKHILHEKGILSKQGKGGKRALRIYPPWDIASNQQAKKTQSWQLVYFLEIPLNDYANATAIRKLFY